MSALKPDTDDKHDLGSSALRWRNLFVHDIDIATNITTAGSFVFEGTADDFETTFGVVDPTADRTINLPNQSGTLPVLAAASTTAITATPEELNLLDATAGSSVALATGDALIIGDASDSNATKKVLMSDVITLLSSTTFTFTNGNPVTIQDATDASSDTTGALIVTGGISTAADLFVGDDLVLESDDAELVFGADKEVKLVHTDDFGLHLNDGMRLAFRDQGDEYITSASDGNLKINSGNVINLVGTTIDIDGIADVSGNLIVGGNLTVNGTTTTVDTQNLQVKDANILINDGGSTAGSAGAGLDIEGDGEAVVGFMKVADDTANLSFKAPTGSTLTLDVNADKTLTVAGDLTVELGAGGGTTSVINQDLSSDSATAAFATLTLSASLLPSAVGGADIGALNAEFGDVYIGKDKEIKLGNAQEVTIAHDDDDGLDITAAGSIDLVATADHITATAGGTLLLDAAGVLELNSSAGAISIGNDAVAQAINVGTGGAARTITVGNNTGASSLVLTSGTGDILASSTDAVTVDAAGVLELNSSGGVISIGNDDVDQAINIGTDGERTVNISRGGKASTVNIGNATGASAVDIDSGTGGVNIASTGAGDIVIDSDDTLLLDSDGVLELNSSAGIISIGNDAVDQAINIGTSGVREVTIGAASADDNAGLTLRSNKGGIDIDCSQATGALSLDTAGGAIEIGHNAAAGAIQIGTHASARTITMGNVTGATALALNAGTGGIALASTGAGDISLDSDDTLLLDSDGVLELNSSAGIISIGNDDIDQDINIGTDGERTVNISRGGKASTVNIGNNTGASSVDLLSGTGAITATSGGTLILDAAGVLELNSSGGVISIGNDAVAQNINIGTGDAARTISIGNDEGATALDFDAGTGGITLNSSGAGDIVINSDDTLLLDSDGVLELNSSAGIISIGNDDVDQNINIGTDGERTIQIGTDNGTGSAPSTKVDINAATIELDASTKVLVSTDSFDITSDQSTDPLVRLINTNADVNASRFQFVKDKPGGTAGADGDDIGIIEFVAGDGAEAQTNFAQILAEVSEADNTDEAGKLSLMVGASDGTNTALVAGLILEGEHATGGEVDVTIGAGSSSLTTVAGNLTVTGDITVNGTTTTVNSTTLTVDDKNIELGSVATPTDDTANGGGITLKGATDHTFNWVNATDAWTSSEHIDLATGKKLLHNGNDLLSSTALAATVTAATGLTQVGTLNQGQISSGFGNIYNGTSNITTGGLLKIDVDGTAVGAAGSLTLGAGGDAGLYVTSDDLVIENVTDGKDILINAKNSSSRTVIFHDADEGETKVRSKFTLTTNADIDDDSNNVIEMQGKSDPDEVSLDVKTGQIKTSQAGAGLIITKGTSSGDEGSSNTPLASTNSRAFVLTLTTHTSIADNDHSTGFRVDNDEVSASSVIMGTVASALDGPAGSSILSAGGIEVYAHTLTNNRFHFSLVNRTGQAIDADSVIAINFVVM